MENFSYHVDVNNTIRMLLLMVNKINTDNDVTRFQKRWSSFKAFADGANVSYVRAQLWRHRDSIPSRCDFDIATDAAKHGVSTFDAILSELAKMRSKVKS